MALVQDAQVRFFGASPACVDALNRAGIVPGRQFRVRIGTAEIYAVLASVPDISGALMVHPGLPGGGRESAGPWPTVEE